MKIYLKDNIVFAESENIDDIAFLLNLNNKNKAEPVEKTVIKHRKHRYSKHCAECPYVAKGLRSLNIHRAKLHGYVSPHRAYNRQWKAARAARKVPFNTNGGTYSEAIRKNILTA